MKPVFQTREGSPRGNCTEACVASVLELSLDDVPTIQAQDRSWLDELNGFLKRYDLYIIPLCADNSFTPSGWHLISGKSPRGSFGHCVVGYDGEMVHDPHPSGDGLEKEESYLVFVTLNPIGNSQGEKRGQD